MIKVMKNTPSERMHLKSDPFSTFGLSHTQRHPLLALLKNIIGSGIPLLLVLYLISSNVNANAAMFLGYLIASLIFIYILLDRFEKTTRNTIVLHRRRYLAFYIANYCSLRIVY